MWIKGIYFRVALWNTKLFCCLQKCKIQAQILIEISTAEMGSEWENISSQNMQLICLIAVFEDMRGKGTTPLFSFFQMIFLFLHACIREK